MPYLISVLQSHKTQVYQKLCRSHRVHMHVLPFFTPWTGSSWGVMFLPCPTEKAGGLRPLNHLKCETL